MPVERDVRFDDTLAIHFKDIVARTHVVKISDVVVLIPHRYIRRIFSRNAVQERKEKPKEK